MSTGSEEAATPMRERLFELDEMLRKVARGSQEATMPEWLPAVTSYTCGLARKLIKDLLRAYDGPPPIAMIERLNRSLKMASAWHFRAAQAPDKSVRLTTEETHHLMAVLSGKPDRSQVPS